MKANDHHAIMPIATDQKTSGSLMLLIYGKHKEMSS